MYLFIYTTSTTSASIPWCSKDSGVISSVSTFRRSTFGIICNMLPRSSYLYQPTPKPLLANMPVTVKIDVKEAVAKFQKEFSRLTPAEFNKATATALNETITQARTQIKRDIMGRYNITSAFLTNKTLQIDRARPSRLYADLNISTANVPLISFKATKVTTANVASAVTFRTLKSGRVKAVKGGKVKAGGVQVSVVKGRSAFIRGAFIINAKYGQNVAHRAFLNGGHAYSGGAFQFRNQRAEKKGNDTPVGSMLALSPFSAGTSQEVQRRLNGFLLPKFEERMLATINRLFPGK